MQPAIHAMTTPRGDTGSARAALRAATRAVHDRLHDSRLFAAILAGTVDDSSYRRLLLQLYGFHKPLEDCLVQGAARCI